MADGLKPCPFCGGEVTVNQTPMTGMWGAVCDCASHIFYGAEHSKEKTIEAWNTRAERTCHDTGGIDENEQDVFNCDKCGCVLRLYDRDGMNTLCTSSIYDYPRYCPACGAKVVE